MAWNTKHRKAARERVTLALSSPRPKRPFDVTMRHNSPPTRKLPSMGNAKGRRQPSMPRMPWESAR